MLIDRIDYVLDHSAVGSHGWDDPNISPDRRAAPQLLVLHDRHRLDVRAARPHRHRPHLHRERLPARRLDVARHADRSRTPGSTTCRADEVRKVTWENASKLFRHPVPEELQSPMNYTEDAVSGAGARRDRGRCSTAAAADDPHPRVPEGARRVPGRADAGHVRRHGVHVSRYEDVMWALKHPEVFSSKDVVKIGNDVPLIPLSVDPPDHAKYRRLLDPQFSPKKMAELEPEMRKLVNEIIDAFIDRGECDFHEDFATPLPSTIFLALMGLPQADLPRFLKWRDDTIRPRRATRSRRRRRSARRRATTITEYFERALAEKRDEPRRPVAQHDRARRGRRPAADARRAARHVPPAAARRARHRDRDARLHDRVPRAAPRAPAGARRRSRARWPAAIEELLRHQTPVMMVPRDHRAGRRDRRRADDAPATARR